MERAAVAVSSSWHKFEFANDTQIHLRESLLEGAPFAERDGLGERGEYMP